MSISSYKELKVWQTGMDLSEQVYRVTQLFPRTEIYGMTSQLRRASVSIPANIAEGWGRQSTGDYIHFLKISQGSAAELDTELLLAQRLNLTEPESLTPLIERTLEEQKMLRALIQSLQAKKAAVTSSLILAGLLLLPLIL
ncbi:MAG: four helix bundle protein [Lentisphaerae bacterium]|nr:four helix bundle protein [Lentisphaerota bacterium]